MNLLKAASAAAIAVPLFATPTMASTDGGAYVQHLTTCLGLLFTDPKAHEAECGPFTAPPFWFPTGGSAPTPVCETGELQTLGPARPLLVAGDPCTPQCSLINGGWPNVPGLPWTLVLPLRDGTLVAGC